MAITVQLDAGEITLIRAALFCEQGSNRDVLEMLRSSDPADPRVARLIIHHEERALALDELLKKIR